MPDVSRSQFARLDHVCKAFMAEAMGHNRGRSRKKASTRRLPHIAITQQEVALPKLSDEESGLSNMHTIQYEGLLPRTVPGCGRFPPLSLPSTWVLLSMEADKMMQSTSSMGSVSSKPRRRKKASPKTQPRKEGSREVQSASAESEQRAPTPEAPSKVEPRLSSRRSSSRPTMANLRSSVSEEERPSIRPLSAKSTETWPVTPYSAADTTPRQVRVATSADSVAGTMEKGYSRRYQSTRSFDKGSMMQSDMGETEFEEVAQAIFDQVKEHNEVHRSELNRALELVGFVCPRQDWVDQIFERISPQYNTIEIDEFAHFLRDYAAFRDDAYEQAFRRCDADGSGQIDSCELAEMLEELDVEPMSHVLEEVIEEVDKDQGGTLDLDEFKELLDLLHLREGFTRPEFEEFMGIFQRFQRRSWVDTKDLPSILSWLGFSWSPEKILQLTSAARLDSHGFIVFMRKVRESELETVQRILRQHDTDGSGTIGMHEVVPLLKDMGYELWDVSAIFEAAEEAGVENAKQGMDLSGLWRLLLTYRQREGFCNVDLQQVDGAFEKGEMEQLPALEAMRALRELGFTSNFLVMQSMLNKVDVDDTGCLDKREFRKMVRMLQERETVHYKKAFHAALPAGKKSLTEQEAAQAIKDLGFRVRSHYLSIAAQVCAKSNRSEEPFLDLLAFVRVCAYHARELREVYKSNGGWTEAEVSNLQTVFDRYDAKHSGRIASKELVRMVEDLFPVLARDRKLRPELQRIMKEVLQETWCFHGLTFKDFLKLMQLFREFQDRERAKKELQAVHETGFSSQEVAQFRDFFLAAHTGQSQSSAPVELSFYQFWKMICDITPLGSSLTAELREIFHEFTEKTPGAVRSKQSAEDADFPEFLLMMKHLMDINFAKIQDKTRSIRS